MVYRYRKTTLVRYRVQMALSFRSTMLSSKRSGSLALAVKTLLYARKENDPNTFSSEEAGA